jgi:uncharacterized surface protein with fasciclin (FAS1) repeats
MRTKKTAMSAALALALLVAAGCESSSVPRPTLDIVATAQAAGQFNTLLTAVEAAGLTATLRSPGPFTVLAPTDAAFAALPAGTLEAVLADEALLTAILTYHVIAGEYTSVQVRTLSSAETVSGESVEIAIGAGGELRIDGVRVVQSDIRATNGIIHVLEAVLIP